MAGGFSPPRRPRRRRLLHPRDPRLRRDRGAHARATRRRAAPVQAGPDRVALNLPAGFLEPGEAPLVGARRELLEETGYTASEWRQLGSYVTDGNRGAGTGHFFLALGARQVRPPDSGDLEAMTVELRSLPQLRQALADGEIPVLPIAAAISLALISFQDSGDSR